MFKVAVAPTPEETLTTYEADLKEATHLLDTYEKKEGDLTALAIKTIELSLSFSETRIKLCLLSTAGDESLAKRVDELLAQYQQFTIRNIALSETLINRK